MGLFPSPNQFATNTLYVDGINGSDFGGVRQYRNRPFKTITAALAAASSGDTVRIGAATYTERLLLKNGVNQYYEDGAIVNYSGTVNGGIFDDTSTGTNSAVVCNITGHAQFIRSGTANVNSGDYWIFKIGNAGSAINVECRSLSETLPASRNGTDGQGSGCIRHTGGSFNIRCNDIYSLANNCWWWDAGETHVAANTIIADGTGLGIYVTATHVVNNAWIEADLIQASTYDAVQLDGTPQTDNGTGISRVWIRAKEIISHSCAVFGASNNYLYCYIDAEKIGISGSASGPDGSSRTIDWTGGTISSNLWITAQKIACGTKGIWLRGGTTDISALHIEDLENVATTMIQTDVGTHNMAIGRAIGGTSAGGILHTGGTLRFVGLIDTTAASSATPVTVSSAGLTLEDTDLIPNSAAADVITAGTAQTVTCNSVRDPANKGVHVNVTVSHSPVL